MKVISCLTCGKKIKVYEGRNKKFCSLKCWREYQKKSKINKTKKVKCRFCGKIFTTTRNAKYCSLECYNKHVLGDSILRKRLGKLCLHMYDKHGYSRYELAKIMGASLGFTTKIMQEVMEKEVKKGGKK